MSETTERSAAEQRGLLRFAQGLGLDEDTVREIYEAVREQAAEAGVGDDDRMAEVRKRMLTAAREAGCDEESEEQLKQAVKAIGLVKRPAP
ncbi:CRISPR/Cas system CSM-associated protein Csm2 small subunit [Methylobacterium sp. RAS18]|nr:CRISPR/Cas system CSM-associated protein Csm2 small subunit [Methylobacterium sp. RAS18]